MRKSETSAREKLASSLLREHLEEASSLYGQRLKLFENPEIGWKDIVDFEKRFQTHIDGLMVGGEQALETCMEQALTGDSGELFAAVCLFCVKGHKELVIKAFEGLDPEDGERQQAMSDALNHEMPDQWGDAFVRMLPEHGTNAINLLAKLAGYRRLSAGPELLGMLPGMDPEKAAGILWALGRIRFQDARPLMAAKYLQDQDESISTYAALALLRMGEPDALKHCMAAAVSQEWSNTLLGISAGRSAVPLLLSKASREKPVANCLLGLGLLGDISAVEALLAHFSDPETAEAAALALNLITGAEIYEQAFIPDEVDEDELFPEELENFRKGEAPKRSDGKPYGVTITRLSRNPLDWQAWWSKHRSLFKPDIRYRSGRPFSPAGLLENLKHEKTPFKIRQLAYEELVIRYGKDFPFEADMYVSRQERVLADIGLWAATDGARFQAGIWYFAGQPIV